MKKLLLLILIIALYSQAQNVINFNIGPGWPKDFRDNDYESKTAWSSAVEYGWVFDKRIIIGAKIDFMWKVIRQDSDTAADEVTAKSRLFMFPASFFLHFDPIPQYALHPVVRAQIGYNSTVVDHDEINENAGFDPINHKNGYYYGFIAKLGADAVIDVGKQAAFFAGFEYQISPNNQRKVGTTIDKINLNAPLIRMGLSVLF